MIIQILRILTLILVIFSIIVDVDIPIILHTQINQLIIAIVIIIIILLIDEIIGFLLGLLFLILYFKYYQKLIKNNSYLKEPLITNNENNDNNYNNNDVIINNNNNNDKNKEIKPMTNNKIEQLTDHYIKYSNDCIEMPYISNELLDKAQNNIFDVNNYNQEIRITNDTYGVQGLNSDTIHYPAFDNSYLRFDNYDNKL